MVSQFYNKGILVTPLSHIKVIYFCIVIFITSMTALPQVILKTPRLGKVHVGHPGTNIRARARSRAPCQRLWKRTKLTWWRKNVRGMWFSKRNYDTAASQIENIFSTQKNKRVIGNGEQMSPLVIQRSTPTSQSIRLWSVRNIARQQDSCTTNISQDEIVVWNVSDFGEYCWGLTTLWPQLLRPKLILSI